jgi:hypothetical protein
MDATPPSPVVPAEFVGLSRLFRERMTNAADVSNTIMRRICRSAHDTNNIRKGRGLRPDTLADLCRAWRAVPSGNRISLAISHQRRHCEIVDVRILPAMMTNNGRPSDTAEAAVTIVAISLTASPEMLLTTSPTVATASLHALARHFQRARRTGDTALITDLGLLATARIAAPGPFSVATDNWGAWHGEVGSFTDAQKTEALALNVRTFV